MISVGIQIIFIVFTLSDFIFIYRLNGSSPQFQNLKDKEGNQETPDHKTNKNLKKKRVRKANLCVCLLYTSRCV